MGKILSGSIMAATALAALNCLAEEAKDAAPSALKVHAIFMDNMVLQRGMPLRIWGTAKPSSAVTVRFCPAATAGRAAQEKTTKAAADGHWMAVLDPLQESPEPAVLEVSAGDQGYAKFANVLVGDVWLCSGQSNMQLPLQSASNAVQEIAGADYPQIRLLTPEKKAAGEPLRAMGRGTGWIPCSPGTVPQFSAVGYFFGRELHRQLKMPIGLINCTWGGTPAEAWTTFKTLAADPDLNPIVKRYAFDISQEGQDKYRAALAAWDKIKGDRREDDRLNDPGNKGVADGWAKPDFDDSGWKTMKLPCLWEDIMNIDGAVWFRKAIAIPEDWGGKDLTLTLGPVDDFDVTYFNGEQVGTTGEETPDWWLAPRKYTVPGRLVKAGRNCVAIRVFDNFGGGGFGGNAGSMALGTGAKTVALAGDWKNRVEYGVTSPMRPSPPLGPDSPLAPATLYNGVISPLIPYGIKGVIWYQGESNTGRGYQYRKLLPAMIADWRKGWNQSVPGADFPFLIVQLASMWKRPAAPEESGWAELREAQALTVARCKNCGLAVTIDIGEATNIHPPNKQDVGRRLALAALKIAYGQDLVFSGPTYDAMEIQGDKIVLRFRNVGGGLVAKGGALKHFAIAGENREFVWADAVIDGDTITVSSGKAPKPVAVRYAWASNPEGCNLYNREGLPAAPFRTDNWAGLRAESR